MASNISLASVIYLIFNQCKNPNSELVDANKIIEYIMNNFDYNNEEADQLQFNDLFESLKAEGEYKSNLLSKDDFEKVFKSWIPLVENHNDQLLDVPHHDGTIFNSTQNRLSRSLTNLKHQIDTDHSYNYCDNLCHWNESSLQNDENMFNKLEVINDNIDAETGNISPHEDPFNIPLNVIRSTPIKKHRFEYNKIGILQQPDLRFIKQHRDLEQSSFSDTETLSKYEESLYEDDSVENLDFEKHRRNRRRSRTNILGQGYVKDIDSRDLISQLRQIKFKNAQLVEINERLQSQLEAAEDNIRILNNKFMDLEKKNRYCVDVNEENKQLIIEIDDIRKRVDSEIELKRRIQSEKIMTESELTAAKEYIQSLIDKLSALDVALDEKEKMIINLSLMIKQQEEFCIKLQDLNSEKDEELQKNQKGIRKLTDAIYEYEEKIHIISKERDDLSMQCNLNWFRKDAENFVEDIIDENVQNRECGSDRVDLLNRSSTQSEYKGKSSENAPWSIKLELATELIDSTGDSPLCEKLCFNDELLSDSSDDSSFQMLNELSTMINSLRKTLSQYREQLELASQNIKNNGDFSDEISLSYLSHLNESINLLSLSAQKAANCQNQFNETFNLLMKRISILRIDKKTLLLQNEKLSQQLQHYPNSSDVTEMETLCFLEEELRKERLLCIEKGKEIETLKDINQVFLRYAKCSFCGKSRLHIDYSNDMPTKDFDALNLEDRFNLPHNKHGVNGRRFTVCEMTSGLKEKSSFNRESRVRMSSASLGDLTKTNNKDEDPNNENLNLLQDVNVDQELEIYRNYNISTENLSNIPRYKISRTHTDDIDIEGLIENSWLEPPSKFEERRASVFVQSDNEPNQSKNVKVNNSSDSLNVKDTEHVIIRPTRTRSSSCSSSNDTSDANSVDSQEERKKLAQQLEYRTLRLQSRSPATTILNCSLVSEDLKSLTAINNESAHMHLTEDDLQTAEPYFLNDVSIFHEYSQNENIESHSSGSGTQEKLMTESSNTYLPRERKESVILPSTTLLTQFDNMELDDKVDIKPDLPKISIIEPSIVESDNNVDDTQINSVNVTNSLKINQTPTNDCNNDLEPISMQISLNKSNYSSRASSVVGDESNNSNSRLKIFNRPHTTATIGINSNKSIQDDSVSTFDDPSISGDTTDIQEAIDILNETSRSLEVLSPEGLEKKYFEAAFLYRNDRRTVIDRANDANNKCNKALTNVEQEFNILRHLIKNMSMITEQPCDLIPRIKTSINVLEKCVEYLSAKSEMFGSVQQEIKLSCLTDLMKEFNSSLLKQRANHIKEIEELNCMFNEYNISNNTDQSRSKKSILAGKDPKTRFQIIAQTTATKTSILRQLTNSPRRLGNQSASPDISVNDQIKQETKLPSSRSSSNQSLALSDVNRKVNDDDNIKSTSKVSLCKFFPTSPALEDSGDNLYQKGFSQGLRLNTDQSLTDLRAQQSKFSMKLDSLSDMIEDNLSSGDELDFNEHKDTRITEIKHKLALFFYNLKTAVGRFVYVVIGTIVMVGLLLPWILIPPNSASSFSVPVSRRRSYSFPDISQDNDGSDSSSRTSSALFLSSNINVVRHKPAAV